MNKIKIFGMGLAALALASCSTPQKPAVDTAKPVEPVSSAKRPVFDAAAESVASSGFNENVNVQQFIQYEVKTAVSVRKSCAISLMAWCIKATLLPLCTAQALRVLGMNSAPVTLVQPNLTAADNSMRQTVP